MFTVAALFFLDSLLSWRLLTPDPALLDIEVDPDEKIEHMRKEEEQ